MHQQFCLVKPGFLQSWYLVFNIIEGPKKWWLSRAHMRDRTPLGKEAKSFIAKVLHNVYLGRTWGMERPWERGQSIIQGPTSATQCLSRAHMRDGTPLGKEAKSFIDKGDLVPDSVMVRFKSKAFANSILCKVKVQYSMSRK